MNKPFDAQAIQARIKTIAKVEFSEEIASDIAFHMTDWLDDLESYVRFCEAPYEKSDDQISKLMTEFLVHVPNHLAAAAKLYIDCPVKDIFEVGAVVSEKDE